MKTEQDREVEQLYRAYEGKELKPETALEIASDFVLDLVNVFGDNLDKDTPLKEGWKEFVPFEFILGLNEVLEKYKRSGYDEIDEIERPLFVDHGILLGSLVRQALTSHPDSFPGEEHYQIPDPVAQDLLILTETS